MRKIITLLLTVLLLAPPLCVWSYANEPAETVYITIAKEGKIVLANVPIYLSDGDGDGVHTLNDALYAAHEERFDGGAKAGYSSSESEYGISLTMLWGDSSGAYGYCINNASAMSLLDEVKSGDCIYAYVYKDQAGWSDKYSYFDKNSITAKKGDSVTLTLSSGGYDQNWNPITSPVEGAAITINGEATKYKTDAEGKVTVKLDKKGDILISAVKDGETLVPPICTATISSINAFSLSARHVVSISLIAAIAVITVIKLKSGKKNASE